MRSSLLHFGGPVGNAVLILALPMIPYALYFAVMFNQGAVSEGPHTDVPGFLAAVGPTWAAVVVYVGWFLGQAALQAWAPGRLVEGTELPGGQRLTYKMNGPASVAGTAAGLGALVAGGVLDPGFAYTHFGSLLTVMTLFAFGLSGFVYWWGLQHHQSRHLTGSRVADFFMGTGHNPRLPAGGLFDLKFFCEGRPGLILWVVVDLSLMWAQYEIYGFVTTAMLLLVGFHTWYVVDYFANEPKVLTTLDIKHENFGFMLVFGDLVWVPMTYTIGTLWCVDHAHDLPTWMAVVAVGLHLGGYAVFRSVNSQKDRFRADPDESVIWGKKAEYPQTERGTMLLLSGFWGWSRHFNYVGDLMMAVGWTLPCGFVSLIPWWYPVYFMTLLVHRERRDNALCEEKYGDDWAAYCERVPWRILPGVY